MSPQEKYRIEVQAVAEYLPAQSDPAGERHVFAYHITITNHGTLAARLISRHWLIEDGAGKTQEVRGEGVVGEQPLLAPGESYRYSSGASLSAEVGTMRGSYQMVAEDGMRFEANIPPFVLAMPRVLH
ncbi:Co2+/Mg2+ efflux protein ApaG [Pseudothauera nasutitermitis]|uniref:Protein ApaG n=1 Tax=Pseudothauera nasutitermitis TaxID=2565930 RepID=A0A4S4AQ73_9RHOO|nr:Co2+/Mg2+ efflux protein ApaG [Pseudothauera nasutitermitis]THF61885.1 Co2+/Mg2+ efflux protein ApaG [Pseudothauera nasutitermitis]